MSTTSAKTNEDEFNLTRPDDRSLSASSGRAPLRDDLNCVERLSHLDQGHPHIRLAFLWNIVYRGCDEDLSSALETWLSIIEGTTQYDRWWLWEDGDEEWLQMNITDRRGLSDFIVGSVARLYPGPLRFATSCLSKEDWTRAGSALRRRLDRANGRDAHIRVGPLRRVQILTWFVLTSQPMRNISSRQDSPHCVAYWDLPILISTWHLSLDLRTSDDDGHASLACLNGISRWVVMMSKLYPLREIEALCLNLSLSPLRTTRYDLRPNSE